MKSRPATVSGHSWTRVVIPSLRWLLLCVLMLEFTLLLLLLAGRWTTAKPRDAARVSTAPQVVERIAPTASSYIETVRALHAQVRSTFPTGGTLADASPEELSAFGRAVDSAYQDLVTLVVPAELRALHFQLVLAYNGLREASTARGAAPAQDDPTGAADQPDPAVQESDARSRIQSLSTEYPWVTAL